MLFLLSDTSLDVSLHLLESCDDLSSWDVGASFPCKCDFLSDSSSASGWSSSRLASSGVSNVAGLASEMHKIAISSMATYRQVGNCPTWYSLRQYHNNTVTVDVKSYADLFWKKALTWKHYIQTATYLDISNFAKNKIWQVLIQIFPWPCHLTDKASASQKWSKTAYV